MSAIPDGEYDERALRVLTAAIREVGGASTLIEHQEQAVLPTLVEACYALVLRQEARLGSDEVATLLGISRGAVDSILAAPMEAYVQRLRYKEDRNQEFDRHTDPDWSEAPPTGRQDPHYVAGALAKFGYDVVQRETPSRPPA